MIISPYLLLLKKMFLSMMLSQRCFWKMLELYLLDENSCLTGVLSRKDLLRASIGQKDLNTIPVHIIMTRMPNIAVCKKADLLIDAAKKLIDRQIDGLPVIKETDYGLEVIGRITKTTITKVFVELITDNHV